MSPRVLLTIAAAGLVLTAVPLSAQAKSRPSCNVYAKSHHLKPQLTSGGLVAYGRDRHQLTFCDTKKRTTFEVGFFDDGQVADRMVAVAGRCVALTTRTPGALPSLITISLPKDLRSNGTASYSGSSLGYGHASATVESLVLSSNCVAAAGVDAEGTLQVEATRISAGTHATFPAGPGTTAAELRKLQISGSTISWTEAGAPRSETVS